MFIGIYIYNGEDNSVAFVVNLNTSQVHADISKIITLIISLSKERYAI